MIRPITQRKSLTERVKKASENNQRLAAPLVGFPGCDILGISLKVAQQNHGVHYSCIETLVYHLKPDAAFMMMDLSVEANALGLPVRFPVHESSSVEHHPVKTIEELNRYRCINILQDARIQSYIKTVEMMKTGLPNDVLVGAYVIGPVTLAGLLAGAEQVAMDSVMDPDKLDVLCEFSTAIIHDYSRALINAGADILCVLEPTAVILGPKQFERFSVKYTRYIIDICKSAGVDTVYHICGNTMHIIDAMAKSGVTALSLDSPETGVDMVRAAQIAGENVVIMGNINPTAVMKDGSVEDVKSACKKLLEEMRDYPNFLLSTGCDLPPGVPLKNMQAFMQTVREFK